MCQITRTMKQDRKTELLNKILESGGDKVANLAASMGVSEVTIRKDLSELEKQGLIKRLHGEAKILESDDIPFRMNLNYHQKLHVARLAAEFVQDGDTIFIEAGSANAFFSQEIKKKNRITVITSNVYIARLFRDSAVQVILLGGIYQFESESLIGPFAKHALEGLHFSKAFFGLSGFTYDTGFTLNDMMRADIIRTIINKKIDNYIITDSSKFGITHANPFCQDFSKLKAVITDEHIPEEYLNYFKSKGLAVMY